MFDDEYQFFSLEPRFGGGQSVAGTLEESDDLAWAKPNVDEALADGERGDVISLEEHEARNTARLAAMKA
ncbi:MAG: hypothetical protein ACHQAY_09085 [Hyphomicrobiales bacterium]